MHTRLASTTCLALTLFSIKFPRCRRADFHRRRLTEGAGQPSPLVSSSSALRSTSCWAGRESASAPPWRRLRLPSNGTTLPLGRPGLPGDGTASLCDAVFSDPGQSGDLKIRFPAVYRCAPIAHRAEIKKTPNQLCADRARGQRGNKVYKKKKTESPTLFGSGLWR